MNKDISLLVLLREYYGAQNDILKEQYEKRIIGHITRSIKEAQVKAVKETLIGLDIYLEEIKFFVANRNDLGVAGKSSILGSLDQVVGKIRELLKQSL